MQREQVEGAGKTYSRGSMTHESRMRDSNEREADVGLNTDMDLSGTLRVDLKRRKRPCSGLTLRG